MEQGSPRLDALATAGPDPVCPEARSASRALKPQPSSDERTLRSHSLLIGSGCGERALPAALPGRSWTPGPWSSQPACCRTHLAPCPQPQRGWAGAWAAGQGWEGSRPQRPDAREAGREAGRRGEKPGATPLTSRGQGSWRKLQLWTRSPRAPAQRGRKATLLWSMLTPRAVGLGRQGHRSLSRETRLLSPPTPHPRCPVSAGHPGPASPLLAPVAQPLEYLQLSHRI